jgi:hypothetical protein
MRYIRLLTTLSVTAFALLAMRTDTLLQDQTPRFYAEAKIMSSDDDCCYELLIIVHEIGTNNLSDRIRAYGTMLQGPCCGELTGQIMDSPLMQDNAMQQRAISRLLESDHRLMEMINRAAAEAIRNFQLQRGGPFRRFEISPERAFSTVRLTLISNTETSIRLRMVDFNGEVVVDYGDFVVEEGSNEFNLSLKGLGPGFYFIKIKQESRIYTLPVEKQG